MDYSNYNARIYGNYDEIWRNTGKCVLCDLRDKYIVTELDNVVLTVSLFPYIDGHLMIVPRRHFESYDEIRSHEWEAIRRLVKVGSNLLKDKLKISDIWFLDRLASGYRSQKTIAHKHSHLIPYSEKLFRWEFQKIKIAPFDLAKKLREGLNS